MKPRVARTFPKISTMPRNQTAATAHLEMYKLLVEKQRLELELETLEQRQQQIIERLTSLEAQVGDLEQTTQIVQAAVVNGQIGGKRTLRLAPAAKPAAQPAAQFETLFLEY
jgi:hypothetical protein